MKININKHHNNKFYLKHINFKINITDCIKKKSKYENCFMHMFVEDNGKQIILNENKQKKERSA